jgi:hypothetical protein
VTRDAVQQVQRHPRRGTGQEQGQADLQHRHRGELLQPQAVPLEAHEQRRVGPHPQVPRKKAADPPVQSDPHAHSEPEEPRVESEGSLGLKRNSAAGASSSRLSSRRAPSQTGCASC